MRYDTTLEEDVADLLEAIQRTTVAEKIGAYTIRAYNPGANGAAVDAVLSHIATDGPHGARAAVFYDVDTEGDRSLAGALIDHSAEDQAEFTTSRLAWLANIPPRVDRINPKD
jgi:hypothetical protein